MSRLLSTLVLTLLSQLPSLSQSQALVLANSTRSQTFTWNQIAPSAELVWHDCYSHFQCARLSVPLNYSDPNASQAAIAVKRIRSSFPVNSPDYRGPILLNPGGPGASGVDFVTTVGDLVAQIVGPQFDVVGFDPRGIARSTPRVSFFEPIERASWGVAAGPGPLQVLNTSADGVARAWARSKITNDLAGIRQSDLLRHINTDQSARDMLRIVQAHGQEKLQYWGLSYGSVLGSTFAAMFPDRVERLVLDGVVDVENYYKTLWTNNLLDTEKAMQHFFDSCYAAGPFSCPFYAPSPKAIAQNLSSLYHSIHKRPIPVKGETSYGLVDYNRLRLTVFSSLYAPHASFLPLSEALSDLVAGKGERLFEMLAAPQPRCNGDPTNDDPDAVVLSAVDAFSAVVCNDGAEVSPALEDFEDYFTHLTEQSEWGELWSTIRVSCIGWPKLPKTQFRGPIIGNVSFPILFIGNAADPVTPLSAAKKVAKGFPSSVVLTVDGFGHCSVGAGPSPCAMKVIRDYFVDGILPPPNTTCPVIGSPFPLQPALQVKNDERYRPDFSGDDRGLYEVSRALNSMQRAGLGPL